MLSKKTMQIFKKITKNIFVFISPLAEQAGIYSICLRSFIFQIVNFLLLPLLES